MASTTGTNLVLCKISLEINYMIIHRDKDSLHWDRSRKFK